MSKKKNFARFGMAAKGAVYDARRRGGQFGSAFGA